MKRQRNRRTSPAPCSESVPAGLTKMLTDDNVRMRQAGCRLAEAAIYTAREYDGVHRLMLAVADWAKAIADEGGRPHIPNTPLSGTSPLEGKVGKEKV